jgi:hypothetical protein
MDFILGREKLKDFNTPVEQIYEVWQEVMRKSHNNPRLELNEKYLNRFKLEAEEIGMTKLPIWALSKSASDSVQALRWGRYKLKFKNWKKNALKLVVEDERSDIKMYPDGTSGVIPGSPTDIGRKKIGPIQNYGEDS